MKYPHGKEAEFLLQWSQNGATKEVLRENFNISAEQASYIKMKAPPIKKFDRRGDHNLKLRKKEYSLSMVIFAKMLIWARAKYGSVSRNTLNDLVDIFLGLELEHPGVSVFWQMYVSGWTSSDEQVAEAIKLHALATHKKITIQAAPATSPEIPGIKHQELVMRLAKIHMRLGLIKRITNIKNNEADQIYRSVAGIAPPSGPLPEDIINNITRSYRQQNYACHFIQLACMSGAIDSKDLTTFILTYEAYRMSGIDPEEKFESSHAYLLLEEIKKHGARKLLTPCSCGMPIFPSRGTTQSTKCTLCRLAPSSPAPKSHLAKARAKLWKMETA